MRRTYSASGANDFAAAIEISAARESGKPKTPVESAGTATEVAPMSSARRRACSTAEARSISSPYSPPFHTGPTA